MLTQKRLKEVLILDKSSGRFVRLKTGTLAGGINYDERRVGDRGRWEIRVDGVRYPASKLVWLYVYGEWPDQTLDHRDLDTLNDRVSNLRKATPSQNGANKRMYRSNKSGFKGVSQFQNHGKLTNRWRAQIKKNGRVIALGLFDTPEEAAIVYQKAAKKFHGEFART